MIDNPDDVYIYGDKKSWRVNLNDEKFENNSINLKTSYQQKPANIGTVTRHEAQVDTLAVSLPANTMEEEATRKPA